LKPSPGFLGLSRGEVSADSVGDGSRCGLAVGLGSGVGVFSAEMWALGVCLGVGFGGGSREWVSVFLIRGAASGLSRVLTLFFYFRKPLGCTPKDTADAIRLFGGDHRKVVDLSLCMSEWKYLLEDGAKMEGTFLDVALRHCAFRADHDVRCQYHFTHNWISRNLQMQLNTEGRTWDAIGAWLSEVLRSSTGWENTLVVPYHDKDHWSIFIIELSRTYHLDPLHGLHSDRYVKNFVFLVHMGWALAKGVVIGSDPWHSILKHQPFEVPAPKQQENWECGYAACVMFWQFMIERGSRLESDVNLLFVKDNWI
jgi:hypothetical protein